MAETGNTARAPKCCARTWGKTGADWPTLVRLTRDEHPFMRAFGQPARLGLMAQLGSVVGLARLLVESSQKSGKKSG